ncbi:phage holin family protein [soil metagenome]|nr:phage holin family protein [Actinomycetota bacterium]
MSSAHSEQIRPDVENRSVGELIGELSSDLSTLMRQEVALAKAELTQEASKAGQAAGMLAGAGVAAHLAIIFASLTAMWALGNVMNLAWAALIVTVVWAVVAGALGVAGRGRFKQVSLKPEQTIDTLKEDAQWARTRNS